MTPITALIAFALISVAAIGVEIMYTYATQGFGFGFSSNRPIVEKSPFGLRVQRAYQNQAEAASYIVPVLAAAAIMGLNTPAAQVGASVIIAGRIAFIALYYTGLPFLRVLGFAGGSFGALFLIYLMLTTGSALS